MKYFIPANIDAILVAADADWNGENMKQITTTRHNQFEETEIIVNPITQQAMSGKVHAIAATYANLGYFGFRRGNQFLIIHGRHVIAKGNH